MVKSQACCERVAGTGLNGKMGLFQYGVAAFVPGYISLMTLKHGLQGTAFFPKDEPQDKDGEHEETACPIDSHDGGFVFENGCLFFGG